MSGVKVIPPPNSVNEAFPHQSNNDEGNIRIMTAAVVVLFSVLLFIVCLHLYAKWFWRNAQLIESRGGMDPETDEAFEAHQLTGLEKAVIESLPIFNCGGRESIEKGLDCAVCLCELEEKQTGKLLPKCSHMFHMECIDTWFRSHTTCPLCRISIMPTTLKAELAVPLNLSSQFTLRTVPLDFSSLENISEDSSHRCQVSDECGDANVLQQVQGMSSLSHLEALEPSSGTDLKPFDKRRGQLISLLASEQEESLTAPQHFAIDLPRPSSDSFCAFRSGHSVGSTALGSKLPLRWFSLGRLLNRDKKVAPSASTSANSEE